MSNVSLPPMRAISRNVIKSVLRRFLNIKYPHNKQSVLLMYRDTATPPAVPPTAHPRLMHPLAVAPVIKFVLQLTPL